MTTVKIKSIVTRYGSIEEYILQRIERLRNLGKIKTRLYGFSIDMPLTANPESVIKLKREKTHVSFTFVDTENLLIVNSLLYHWIRHKGHVKFYIDFYNDLMDFYNWYCKAVYEENPNLLEFITYENLNNMLRFYNLHKTCYVVFNHGLIGVRDPTKEFQMPSKLRNVIERFDKYKKLFEAGIV